MDFDRDWHTFSLDAEVDAYGTSRIAGAHNRLREENAQLKAEGTRLAELVQKYHPAYLGLPHVVRERDEARANCVRMSMRAGELGIEVARLEGLILDCGDDAPGSAGKLNREAHRIRAQREEEQHRKHPTGDYCVWCHSQWPCEESSEEGR